MNKINPLLTMAGIFGVMAVGTLVVSGSIMGAAVLGGISYYFVRKNKK